MQKQNSVIKNYILSSEIFVLDDLSSLKTQKDKKNIQNISAIKKDGIKTILH